VELTHTFTVPIPIEETWQKFQDISGLAECFPGAQVTSVEGDTFEGTVKVKLGPIALVYAGSGTFTEKDEAAHKLVVEAKGRDKRGNGTAGATATLTMAADGAGTSVEVHTDLSITGKPAQFGRGVMQDVSDKLLGQFVACLEEKSSAGPSAAQDAAAGAAGAAQATTTEASAPETAAEAQSGTGVPAGAAQPATAPVTTSPGEGANRAGTSGTGAAGKDDALDLGSTVLPVLVRSYGKQAAAGLAGLLGLILLFRLLRRR